MFVDLKSTRSGKKKFRASPGYGIAEIPSAVNSSVHGEIFYFTQIPKITPKYISYGRFAIPHAARFATNQLNKTRHCNEEAPVKEIQS